MRTLLARWRGMRPPATTHLRPGLRPELVDGMCRRCARRWLGGRALRHPWCWVQLRHAFDLHFERLHEDS